MEIFILKERNTSGHRNPGPAKDRFGLILVELH
jgi:hypothetical protein